MYELDPTDAPFPQDILIPTSDNDGPTTTPDHTTLSHELADLSALQDQLTSLSREISRRERWLAQATGTAPPPLDLAACSSISCVFDAILRKAKYAATALFNPSKDNFPDQSSNQTTTLPLPPWRRGKEDDDDADLLPFDFLALNLPFAVFGLLLVMASLFHRFDRDGCDDASVALPFSAAAEESLRNRPGRLREEWRWRFWAQFLRRGDGSESSLGWFWWRRDEGRIRLEDGLPGLEDGERGAGDVGYESRDEKRGIWENEERNWDEKDAVLLEDSEVEDGEVSETESEGESESEGGSESGGLSTLGDELASFRAALDLVEGIVAAEENRAAERQR
ncbi:hypothetical protein N0V88_003155 [Collariella sp. IMI 366227]|nr:hypothetical protein N0V88_003155 [Collariella sp. IMI 366227]